MLKAHGFAADGVKLGISTIKNLFHSGCPLAIVFAISLMVFNSIQGHLVRAVAHIIEKVFKTFQPFAANGYPSSAVIVKPWIVGIAATIFHGLPCMINWSPRHSMFGVKFKRKAPARRNKAISQVATSACCGGSAIAQAIPHCMSAFCSAFFNDSETTKPFPCNVNDCSHVVPLLSFNEYVTVGY
jgi:hypothetical protein